MAGKSKNAGRSSPSKQKAPVQLTGGAGFRFENAVAARFLLDMLSGKNSLGSDFGRVTRVDWQARDAGWLADDLAVACKTTTNEERAAGISIKSHQQLGQNGFHTDFAHIVWRQWLNQGTTRQFRRDADSIVLATGALAPNVKQAWSDLRRQAVAAGNAPERIVARLTEDQGEGVQSSGFQRAIFDSLARPEDLEREKGGDPKERVALIRHIAVLQFDYDTDNSADRVKAELDCQSCLSAGEASDAATLWDRLIGIADEQRPVGGSLDLPKLLTALRGQFDLKEHPDYRADWETLTRHTAEVTIDIHGQIADEAAARLAREQDINVVSSSLAAKRACILVGESGSGKSALAAQLGVDRYSRSVWLSASDLNVKALTEFERGVGLRYPLAETLLAASQPCLIVLDAAETYSSDALTVAARLIKDTLTRPDVQHIHLVITVQLEAAERVARRLSRLGVSDAFLNAETIGVPSDEDLTTLLAALPQLRWISLRPEIRPLLKNLKVLDLVARTLRSEGALRGQSATSLTALIDVLWEDWVEQGDNKYGRSHVLKAVATEEADTFSTGVALQALGYGAVLPGLETAGLVRVKNERVRFTHDLLGDWARLRVLVGENPINPAIGFARMQSPRWHRAIRLFGQRLLELSEDIPVAWRTCVENASDDSTPAALLRDLFLESLFLATNAPGLLARTWPVLIAREGALLRRLLDRFLFVATLPNAQLLAFVGEEGDTERFGYAFRIPQVQYWAPMLTVLHAHRDDVACHASYEAARLCALWLRTMPFYIAENLRMPWRRKAAELALAIAREVQARTEENHYFGSRSDKVVYESLLYAGRDLPSDVAALALELAKRRPLSANISARVQATQQKRRQEQEARRDQENPKAKRKAMMSPISVRGRRSTPQWPNGPASRVGNGFQEACLEDPAAFATLVQADPDAALEVLLAVCIEEPQADEYRSSSLEDYGLAYWHGADPPAYFRGPFLSFLRHASDQGLTFVLRLVNFATERAFSKRGGLTIEIKGKQKVWLGNSNAFRWHHDWPMFHGTMVQSALMALEYWLYERLDQGHDVTAATERIVAESASLAFAGLLFDVGKKAPALFAGPLKPFFSEWLLWSWDFQISQSRAGAKGSMMGTWFQQPQALIELARRWYALPHRWECLVAPSGAIPRIMLSRPEFGPFFEDIRRRWAKVLEKEGDFEHLQLLIERINPANYSFPAGDGENQEIDFQWPEAIARRNEEGLRQLAEKGAITSLPFRCRKIIDAGSPLSPDQLGPFLQWLQALDASPSNLDAQDGEPLFPIETAILAGVALLVALHFDWVREDASRIEWCRARLQAVVDHPPPPSRFDSEVAISSGGRWDDFAAETGVRILAADRADPLARRLVAQAVAGFHYDTTGLAMHRAFELRAQLGDDFDRLITLAVDWAALRVIHPRVASGSDSEAEQASWEAKRSAILDKFVGRTLSADLPELKRINAESVRTYEDQRRKAWPDHEPLSLRRSRQKSFGGSREELYPEMHGFDERVLTAALSWLDPSVAVTPGERARWLDLIRALLQLTLDGLPKLDDPKNQEIKGLPTGFDDWIFRIVARAVPSLRPNEDPDGLWAAIFELGAAAHEWIERFFWHWFTNGLQASESPSAFVRIWKSMILNAMSSPNWDASVYGTYRVDSIAIQLLGLDGRWNGHARDSIYAPALGTMIGDFAQAAELWFSMPRVVRNFLHFLVQPGAGELLLPALPWLANAIASYSTYDWRDGIEDGLVEYLRVCEQRSRDVITTDPVVRKVYFDLLAMVASRGSHAAIALKDRFAS